MTKWHEGNPPKQGRYFMIARVIGEPELHGWDVMVGHWHQQNERYVQLTLPLDLSKGARPKLDVSHWAEIESPVDLRPLSLGDTHG
jgi:hypothetical protein